MTTQSLHFTLHFLADRTNGRAYATVSVRQSVVVCGVIIVCG